MAIIYERLTIVLYYTEKVWQFLALKLKFLALKLKFLKVKMKMMASIWVSSCGVMVHSGLKVVPQITIICRLHTLITDTLHQTGLPMHLLVPVCKCAAVDTNALASCGY